MAARNHYLPGRVIIGACMIGVSGFGVEAAAAEAIEEIVVTAQKREQGLLDVASAITALGAEQLYERSVRNIEDIQGMVPNLVYRDHLGSSLVTIRGIGGNIDTGVVEPGVAVYVDGVYLARSDMLALDFNDLDRIEVLRGPQGTLYGKNATGGAVNFVTAAPEAAPSGQLSLGGGSFDGVRGAARLSGPITDAIAGRISAFYEDDDGYYDNAWTGNDIGGSERKAVRGTLRMDTAAWTVDVSGSYQSRESSGPIQQDFDLSTSAAPLAVSTVFGAGWTNTDEVREVVQFIDPELEIDTSMWSLEVSRDLAGVQLRSVTGYVDHDYGPQTFAFGGVLSDGALAPGADNPFGTIGRSLEGGRRQQSTTFSQEFNLSGGPEGRLQWLLGLYYFEEDFEASIPVAFVDPNAQALFGGSFTAQAPALFPPGTLLDGSLQNIEENNRNVAVFFDATWSFAERWRLNVGGRLGRDDKEVTQNVSSLLLLPPGSALQPAGGSFELTSCAGTETDLEEDEFSPKLRIERDIGENALAYVQWQEATKSGQVNLTICGDAVDPEEISAYEAGYKGAFADERLTVAGSAFFYDYENYQSLEFTPDGTATLLSNVPESEVTGIEVELTARLADWLRFDLAGTWLDSEIKQGTAPDTANPAAGVQDLSGNPLPATPEFTFRAGADVDIQAGGSSLTLRGELAWFDDQAFRNFGVREVNDADGQDSYELVNFYLNWRLPGERLRIGGYLRNATDEDYKYWSLYSTATGFSGNYGPPRHWGVDVTWDW